VFVRYRTKSFILSKIDLGEADQIIFLYTKEFGKLEILAKGVRKITSKLKPAVELFCLSNIEFVQGKNYKTLTDASIINKFKNIKNDLVRFKVIYQISDLINDLIKNQEQDARIWNLILRTFYIIDKKEVSTEKTPLLYYYFFWRLVALLGYYPEISKCKIYEKEINCQIIKIIKFILIKEAKDVIRLRVNKNHLTLLKNISEWYKVKIYEK
jgi:DNA repair protein RecO (recombination protein O)